jgi:hypothetical protein
MENQTSLKLWGEAEGVKETKINIGSDPDSTYFIMSVWPVKNPCKTAGSGGLLERVYLN